MAAKKRVQRDVCQEITDSLIERLEQGALPWQPFHGVDGRVEIPSNASTGDTYNGTNIINLWVQQHLKGFTSSRWMTFKQAREAGGHVRAKEKGSLIVFFKTVEKDSDRVDERGEAVKERFPIPRHSTVFNLDQIDGVDHLRDAYRAPRYDFTPIEIGERLISASNIPLTYETAFPTYRPGPDEISMPDRSLYAVSENFYADYAHELIHATRTKGRCDRKPYRDDHERLAYAFEELVAEQGAVFLCAHIGLPRELSDHAAYINGWLEMLQTDKRAIFKAAAQAQKATDWALQQLDAHLQRTEAA